MNHFNRLLINEGNTLSRAKTPKNLTCYGENHSEGGRYFCNYIFGRNYNELNLNQASFISTPENWEFNISSFEENILNIKLKINTFKENFIKLMSDDYTISSIRMCSTKNMDEHDKICMKYTRDCIKY